jgi:hypothetical protein
MEYKEEQKFNQVWIWIILIITGFFTVGIFSFGLIKQVVIGIPFGDKPMSNTSLIIVFIITSIIYIGLIWFFRSSRLVSVIDKYGIEYRFIPLQSKKKHINWDEIEKYEVKTYHPIREYGGWGVRYGLKGKALNASGNYGLHLYLKNGSRLLIGTQKETGLEEFLNKLFDSKTNL